MCKYIHCEFYHKCTHLFVNSDPFPSVSCSCNRLISRRFRYRWVALCFLCRLSGKCEGKVISKSLEDVYRERNKWRRFSQHFGIVQSAIATQRGNIAQAPNWREYSYFADIPLPLLEGTNQISCKTLNALKRIIQPRFILMQPVQRADISRDRDICLICRGNLRDDSNNGNDLCESSTAVRLPCGHIIGRECIRNWIWKRSICPVCQTRFIVEAYAVPNEWPLLGEDQLGLFEDIKLNRHMPLAERLMQCLRYAVFTLLYPVFVVVFCATRHSWWDIANLALIGLWPVLLAFIFPPLIPRSPTDLLWRTVTCLPALGYYTNRHRQTATPEGPFPWRYPWIPREFVWMNMGPFALLIPFLACYRDSKINLRGYSVDEDFEESFLVHLLSLGYVKFFYLAWGELRRPDSPWYA
jgi:Ring finger domain